MRNNVLRVYVDTSVFGGVFDEEFGEASRLLFKQAKAGRFLLVVSDTSLREMDPAPEEVKDLFVEMLDYAEVAEITEDALVLREAYIRAGILSHKCLNDALHVAVATVSECGVIISWNFKHIVHFLKIPMYNKVNMAHGYRTIAIHSPLEVVEDDEDKDI